MKIVRIEFILEWLHKMKSEELLKIWDNCSPPEKDVREAPGKTDETLMKCLKGTVGEKWNQNNNDAKCISENLPLSACKTTVEKDSGSISNNILRVDDSESSLIK